MSLIETLGALAGRVVLPCTFVLLAAALNPTAAAAQENDHDADHDHDHGVLHFSHPMVTESPSPDTKFRLDGEFLRVDQPVGPHATEYRAEFEYAFAPTFSLAVVVPYDRITFPPIARASAMGSVELSAKAASYAFARSGALVGGGVTVGLPTGSDAKGIGSGHLYEISPFIDAALKRGPVELVGFLTYSALANRDATDENERELTFDGSLLWRAAREIELLAELSTSRSFVSGEPAYSDTFVAPGFKWRPAKLEKFAFGASVIRGVGSASGTNAVQISAFYHF